MKVNNNFKIKSNTYSSKDCSHHTNTMKLLKNHILKYSVNQFDVTRLDSLKFTYNRSIKMSNFSANGANIRQPGSRVFSFTWSQSKKVSNMLATSVTFKKPAIQNLNMKVSDNLVNTLTQQRVLSFK